MRATSGSAAGAARIASRSARAYCRSAGSLIAESTTTDGPASSCVATRASAYASTITCAFVPDAPNELTAARSGARPPPASARGSHRIARAGTKNGDAARSMWGLGGCACSEGAIVRWRICSSTFVSPATPAAASACPTADLIEPSAQYCVSRVCARYARVNPSISIGSPSAVPVPCAST